MVRSLWPSTTGQRFLPQYGIIGSPSQITEHMSRDRILYDPAQNLGGNFDHDADNNIFKATFGGSFGSFRFGNVAQTGLSEDCLAGDLTVRRPIGRRSWVSSGCSSKIVAVSTCQLPFAKAGVVGDSGPVVRDASRGGGFFSICRQALLEVADFGVHVRFSGSMFQ